MLKLYKNVGGELHYWETWADNKVHTIHWGKLGTRGKTKEVKTFLATRIPKKIQQEIGAIRDEGYEPIGDEDIKIVLIEYVVDGFGTEADLEKRHRLEDRMNETLGWTGLGNCDGGSIGSGTMEVCNFVVDFEVAKKTIEEDLKDTEFADYSRIYLEQ